MTLGVLVTIAWEQLRPLDINAVVISLPVAVLALILVSLAVPDGQDRNLADV